MEESQPYIVTRRRAVRHVYWGRIVAFIVIISLAAVGAILWFTRTPGKLIVPSREYWFVSVGEYSDPKEAAERAATVAASGGAGYVYEDIRYRVAAACYSSEADAVTVSLKMDDAGERASVFSIVSPQLKVDKPRSDKSKLKELLDKPYEIFDELYKISVKTDTNEISAAAARYALVKMSYSCETAADECENFSDTGKYLSDLMRAVSRLLDDAASSEGSTPQNLKYALCSVAVEICARTDDFVAR